jgi:hypothetical protein
MFNKIILVFTICLFIFSNNSCQTFDDLQFDNLALRGQIDSLSQRITVLTDEILGEQEPIFDNSTTTGRVLNRCVLINIK